MRAIILIASLLLLAACASTPDPNYAAYLEAATAADQREQLVRGSVGDAAAACNNDATCVVAVAGFAALAVQKGGASAGLQPYRKQYHPAWGILGAAVPAVIQGAVAIRSSDNSRDIALGQYDFLANVIGSVTSSPALQPRDPSITVGGDYISGRQHIGDAVGGDQHIGDAIGRDQIGGDQRIGDDIGGDDNSGNSGRIGSPGPFDNSGQCTGDRCQGDGDINPPPPPPDPGEG